MKDKDFITVIVITVALLVGLFRIAACAENEAFVLSKQCIIQESKK
jgi:hypothetical protein